ncbi:hypothetical protein [Aeoliella sp. SH292]|uniref:hypothetical protein n=1 Tax=Aeoliella sp. SH292 TaxID=3454464 RepID=UPI003F964B5B
MNPVTVADGFKLATVDHIITAQGYFDHYRDAASDVAGVAWMLHGRLAKLDSVKVLRAIAEAEGDPWSVVWLRKKRGQMVLDGMCPDEIDAMPIDEFANRLRGNGKPRGGRKPSARVAKRRGEVLRIYQSGTTKPQAIADLMGADITAAVVSDDIKELKKSGKIN